MIKIPGLPAINLMVKAIVLIDDKTPIPVRFNPESYSVTASPEIKKSTIVGVNGQHLQFISGGGSVLSMVLHYDTYNSPMRALDVRTLTFPLTNLVKIDSERHGPPLVTFVYGSFMFKGMVTKADQKFTMFSRLGIPVRCELTFEITKTMSIEDQQENPKESSDRTKERKIINGDQLCMLSEQEYDTPAEWRRIAEANHIDNPKALTGVHKLTVPAME